MEQGMCENIFQVILYDDKLFFSPLFLFAVERFALPFGGARLFAPVQSWPSPRRILLPCTNYGGLYA